MNNRECTILQTLYSEPFIDKRILSESTGLSPGSINKSLNNLMNDGYLDSHFQLTDKAKKQIKNKSPRNAIILAAGTGMRMVPVNHSVSKAFLEVNGERLIERLIRQLHEFGITDITVVIGFMKEEFEYLIDDFGVNLVVNNEYTARNNLHSLALATDKIQNTYIIPCNIWCKKNPFNKTELNSWYMVSDRLNSESSIRINRKNDLVIDPHTHRGNAMLGIAYLNGRDAESVRVRLTELDDDRHAGELWETVLYQKDRMAVTGRVVNGADYVAINTYEQLRDLDSNSDQLKSDAIETISAVLKCSEKEVTGITVLKKGMTNRSFLFTVNGTGYIMRIPGEGTDRLIDRHQEAEVFRTISGLDLCDEPVYINPENGYKITRYLDGARVCNKNSRDDLEKCIEKLRYFHSLQLSVSHTFDIFGQIEFYESLWEGTPSIYRDYKRTKENVLSLKSFIDSLDKDWCLTHIDAVPDNFLFYKNGSKEEVQLTDWEYSGMQDPHVDIAMFCIYSLYSKKQCDRLIDIYFEDNCDVLTRIKIYAYISICGLLWSNWCEYKRNLGIEFGEYSLRQYRYAKDYYRYVKDFLEESDG